MLSGPALQRVLSLGANLGTNGYAFRLLSGPGSTALVVNSNGVVNGDATVQRYLDPRLNPGLGYRHYSAPVRNTTVSDLATTGFAPVLTPAYNTSPTPGAELAIDGRPLPVPGAPALAMPLAVRGPAPGAYALQADRLLNLLAGTHVYLRDRQAGALIDLQQQPRYAFTLNASATAPRFELLFAQQLRVLEAVAARLARTVALYPNPDTASVTVELPAALRLAAVAATLLDGLGRAVVRQVLPAGAVAHQLSLAAVPVGVYSLRPQTAAGAVVKKVGGGVTGYSKDCP